MDYKKADLYIWTTNEFADYVGWNDTNGASTCEAILKMEIPVLSQQFWEEEVGEENRLNYQAWRRPWVKHEDVVLSGLGTVLRLCPCQDGGTNKLHKDFYNIRLVGTPQAPEKMPTTSKAKNIKYEQYTRQSDSSFTSYKSGTVTTSPSLTVSTTVGMFWNIVVAVWLIMRTLRRN